MIIIYNLLVSTGATVGIGIGALIVGLIIGFFLSKFFFNRYLKKNPPINENMIRAMFQQMGRTPSEKQVRQVMQQMNQNK